MPRRNQLWQSFLCCTSKHAATQCVNEEIAACMRIDSPKRHSIFDTTPVQRAVSRTLYVQSPKSHGYETISLLPHSPVSSGEAPDLRGSRCCIVTPSPLVCIGYILFTAFAGLTGFMCSDRAENSIFFTSRSQVPKVLGSGAPVFRIHTGSL